MAGLWYRTGSVAVTQSSKKITGTGTSWQTALNRPSKGNVFYGPDGQAYEIDYISSETELCLVDVYTGANASSQSYKIDVRGGTVPELSRQLSEHYAYMQGIIDSLQSIVSGSGDVTITGPSGQTVTVPALANMLSKSGSLAGLAVPDVALDNLGLSSVGKAVAKAIDFAAGRTALGIVKQTNSTDTTAGAMLEVGSFGLGGTSKDLTSFVTDLPLNTRGSIFRALQATPGGPGLDAAGLCMPFDGTPIQAFLLVSKSGNRALIGRRSGANTDPAWTELWSAANLTKQTTTVDLTPGSVLINGAYGLGSAGIGFTGNLSEDRRFSHFATASYAANDLPNGDNTNWGFSPLVHVFRPGGSDGTGQIGQHLFCAVGADKGRTASRTRNGNTWSPWRIPHDNISMPYETGTFTPVIIGSAAGGEGTYTAQKGSYTRVGRVVFFSLSVAWSAHTGSGELRVAGVPFTASNDPDNGHYKWASIHANNLTFTGQLTGGVVSAGTYIRIYQMLSNAAATPVSMDASAQIEINGFYFI